MTVYAKEEKCVTALSIAFSIAFPTLVLVALDRGERIHLDGARHAFVADVRIDLRGVELLVTENVLEHTNVNLARLIHQSCGGVAELMNGKSAVVKSCHVKIFIDHPLYGLIADARFSRA